MTKCDRIRGALHMVVSQVRAAVAASDDALVDDSVCDRPSITLMNIRSPEPAKTSP